MSLGVISLLGAAYLVASVNVATLVGQARGVDIRSTGSGNPGASNVMRSIGKGAAAGVYLADLAKGVWPAVVGLSVWDPAVGAAAGLCAVVGHCYPAFHRFRGGKGVATAGGVLLVLAPLALLALVVIYALVVWVTKISSAGSLAGVVAAIPLSVVFGLRGWSLVWIGVMLLLIIWRHRANLSRLVAGSEHRVATP